MSHEETMLARANRAALALAGSVRASAYAPRYHVAAPSGWINDPNGLSRFQDRYHVFYQHYPYGPKWGPMHWGHASSADLAHWRHDPIALAPDQPYESGCFSGSAVDDGGVFTLIYTAHLDGDPATQTQCVARSHDGGKTFAKSPLNPVIPAPPAECTRDFRDPKVWRQDGRWHMVVGTVRDGRGCAALYSSDDLDHWEYRGIMAESDGTLGSMWECPSFCHVDGWDILIVSPMGMPGHKNIAIFGHFDCAAGRMTIHHWQDLDLGDHFYAAQVMEDGPRNLLMAWMNMWGSEDPSEADGWSGMLTLPRAMHAQNGRLILSPAPELAALRGEKKIDGGCRNCLAKLSGDCLEMILSLHQGEISILDGQQTLLRFAIRDGEAVMTRQDGSCVRAKIEPKTENELRLFVDRSAVECFVNGGEACFSQRVYPREALAYRADCPVKADAWAMADAFEDLPC